MLSASSATIPRRLCKPHLTVVDQAAVLHHRLCEDLRLPDSSSRQEARRCRPPSPSTFPVRGTRRRARSRPVISHAPTPTARPVPEIDYALGGQLRAQWPRHADRSRAASPASARSARRSATSRSPTAARGRSARYAPPVYPPTKARRPASASGAIWGSPASSSGSSACGGVRSAASTSGKVTCARRLASAGSAHSRAPRPPARPPPQARRHTAPRRAYSPARSH